MLLCVLNFLRQHGEPLVSDRAYSGPWRLAPAWSTRWSRRSSRSFLPFAWLFRLLPRDDHSLCQVHASQKWWFPMVEHSRPAGSLMLYLSGTSSAAAENNASWEVGDEKPILQNENSAVCEPSRRLTFDDNDEGTGTCVSGCNSGVAVPCAVACLPQGPFARTLILTRALTGYLLALR